MEPDVTIGLYPIATSGRQPPGVAPPVWQLASLGSLMLDLEDVAERMFGHARTRSSQSTNNHGSEEGVRSPQAVVVP